MTVVGPVSLLGNLALLAILGAGALTPPSPAPPAPATAAPAAAAPTAAAARDIWAGLRADDLAAQRDILQAEGFPPAAIRAVLAAQLRERFAARRRAIESAQPEQPYWRNPVPDASVQARLRALMLEEQKACASCSARTRSTAMPPACAASFPSSPRRKSTWSRASGSATTSCARRSTVRPAAPSRPANANGPTSWKGRCGRRSPPCYPRTSSSTSSCAPATPPTSCASPSPASTPPRPSSPPSSGSNARSTTRTATSGAGRASSNSGRAATPTAG
jgi:hypothetical protein